MLAGCGGKDPEPTPTTNPGSNGDEQQGNDILSRKEGKNTLSFESLQSLSLQFQLFYSPVIPVIVWYWNESYLTQLYVVGATGGSESTLSTLVVSLKTFEATYSTAASQVGIIVI